MRNAERRGATPHRCLNRECASVDVDVVPTRRGTHLSCNTCGWLHLEIPTPETDPAPTPTPTVGGFPTASDIQTFRDMTSPDVSDDPDLETLTTDLAAEISHELASREDELIENAIRYTDWTETAVLRILITHRDPLSGPETEGYPFTIQGPSYEVERYAARAPAPGAYEAEGVTEVVTITAPLLERLATTDESIAELVEIIPTLGEEVADE